MPLAGSRRLFERQQEMNKQGTHSLRLWQRIQRVPWRGLEPGVDLPD